MIKVNSKKINLAVNISLPIEINWSEYKYPQKSYILNVYDESNSKLIYKEEKVTKDPFTSFSIIDLKIDERKKMRIELSIEDKQANIKSVTSYFYTSNNQLRKGEWITRKDNPIEKEIEYYKDKSNIILEKTFNIVNEKEEIFLDICGLGYYSVTINDKKISDIYLSNDVTNYDEVIYYDTYKINDFLIVGKNLIKVELANGWYNPAPLNLLGKYNVRKQLSIGKPCLIAQISSLNKNNQKIILSTGKDWKSEVGQYLFNNLFIGEKYSFRKYNFEKFERVVDATTVCVSGPSGELIPSNIPKIKRTRKHLPTNIKKIDEGILITFNEIISGHFSVTITANSSQKVSIKYGESIDGDRINYTSSSPGTKNDVYKNVDEKVIQQDVLLLREGQNNFENQFTYHSFRYVLIEVSDFNEIQIDGVEAFSVHTDMLRVSTFKSSCNWLNKLYEVNLNTKLNNIHSYYEDCPRERLGYGGDIVALIDSQIHSFYSKEMLEKVLNDFQNDQNKDGGITQTAPYMGIQTHGPSDRAGSLGWQYVVPVILNKLIKYYSSIENYIDKLPMIQKHLKYLLSFDYDYIKTCCLGDWGSIDSQLINNKETPPDKEFCSSIFYLLILKEYYTLIIKYSKVVDVKIKKEILIAKIKEVEKSIIKEFYNKNGYFGEGSQSSYAFALKANLSVDNNKIYNNFINKIIEDDYILRSGIFGMSWTYELIEYKDNDILYKWITRKEFPSFYRMIENGNNILPEYFIEDNNKYLNISKNHAMFTSYSTWFIKSLLGISIKKEVDDYYSLCLLPYFPEDISFIKGSLYTKNGLVKVSWNRIDKDITLELELPNSLTLEDLDIGVITYCENNGFKTNYKITYQ